MKMCNFVKLNNLKNKSKIYSFISLKGIFVFTCSFSGIRICYGNL